MSFTRKENIPTVAQWRDAEQTVASLADLQGMAIDSRIADSVVALLALGFKTTASCAGHLDRGKAAPWIDIGVTAKKPKGIIKFRTNNLRAQQRLLALLGTFYQEHFVAADIRLVLIPFGIFGGFTLTNQGSEVQAIFSRAQKRAKLTRFQNEFSALASFVKNRINLKG